MPLWMVLLALGTGLQGGHGLVVVLSSARLLLQGLPGHWRPCNAFYLLW